MRNWLKNPSAFVVIYIYAYLLMLLFNYKNVWVHPEVYSWNTYILEDGASLAWDDLKKGLNWEIFEGVPRISRPLSSYVDMLDMKFRAFMWNFVVPHPSLSLTWLLSLVVSPILLFRLFKNMGIEKHYALGGVGLYIANSGFLSFVFMRFRPAKPLANFAIIGCLYLASALNRLQPSKTASDTKEFSKFLGFCAVLFISFFVDETALVAYPAIAVFFPRIIFKSMKRVVCFATLPFLTYGCYHRVIPWLTTQAGFPYPVFWKYEPMQHFTAFSDLSEFLALRDLALNARLWLYDSFGLINPRSSHSLYYAIVFSLNLVCLGFIVFKIIAQASRTTRPLRTIFTFSNDLLGSSLFLLGTTIFANILLHSVVNRIWGLYWNNTYWAIFLVIFLTILFKTLRLHKMFVAIFVLILASSALYLFEYANFAYKIQRYYPYQPHTTREIFLNTLNRFSLPELDSPEQQGLDLFKKTVFIWQRGKERFSIRAIPMELYYLVEELQLAETESLSPTEWEAFISHFHFDLEKANTEEKRPFSLKLL